MVEEALFFAVTTPSLVETKATTAQRMRSDADTMVTCYLTIDDFLCRFLKLNLQNQVL